MPGCGGILGFELVIHNTTTHQLVLNFRAAHDFIVSDNVGHTFDPGSVWQQQGNAGTNCYGDTLNGLGIYALQPDETQTYAFRVLGDTSSNASSYMVEIVQAGRIHNAKWKIAVPR